MPHRNLAVELLEKLLKGEVSTRRRKNVVQARSFAEMLEKTLRSYQNRAIEAAQVIEELIALAREMREANARGEQLGLSEDELAFYDALETNDSAVQVLGDETLRDIARELVDTVRNNVTIDWTLRENVRANLRRLVRRTLRRHGYPPDKQEKPPKQSSNKPKSSPKTGPPPNHRLTAASPPSLPALPALPAPHPLIALLSIDVIASTHHPRPPLRPPTPPSPTPTLVTSHSPPTTCHLPRHPGVFSRDPAP